MKIKKAVKRNKIRKSYSYSYLFINKSNINIITKNVFLFIYIANKFMVKNLK